MRMGVAAVLSAVPFYAPQSRRRKAIVLLCENSGVIFDR
jgi:hypothetical protein